MKRVLCAVLALTFLVAPVAAGAAEQSQDLKMVTTAELKAMIDGGEKFLLINALSPIEFAEQRIPGSVNVPFSHLVDGTASLPEDKGAKLVFYCKGPKCTKSKKSAAFAVKAGYTSVLVYDEGLPAWIGAGHPTESDVSYPRTKAPMVTAEVLKGMLDGGQNFFLLDIRDTKDRSGGYIEGSSNIPLDYLEKRYTEVPQGKKVVIACHRGKQSLIASRFLASKGYDDLSILQGGTISGWMKAGFPLAN